MWILLIYLVASVLTSDIEYIIKSAVTFPCMHPFICGLSSPIPRHVTHEVVCICVSKRNLHIIDICCMMIVKLIPFIVAGNSAGDQWLLSHFRAENCFLFATSNKDYRWRVQQVRSQRSWCVSFKVWLCEQNLWNVFTLHLSSLLFLMHLWKRYEGPCCFTSGIIFSSIFCLRTKAWMPYSYLW